MSFQRHETPAEKMMRRLKYLELRDSGIPSKCAAIFRDWTLNKVRLISSGYAKPTILIVYKDKKQLNENGGKNGK